VNFTIIATAAKLHCIAGDLKVEVKAGKPHRKYPRGVRVLGEEEIPGFLIEPVSEGSFQSEHDKKFIWAGSLLILWICIQTKRGDAQCLSDEWK